MSSVTALPCATILPIGRPTKFTPEKIQQIRNLVERGKSREEIAELVGVTPGSLAVTCSRLGVSLRRPVFNAGTGLLRQQRKSPIATPRPQPNGTVTPSFSNGGNGGAADNGNDNVLLTTVIKMQYKGRQRSIELPLIQDILGQLALEAEFRDMKIGELINEIIKKVLNKNLLDVVLEQQR